RRLTITDPQFNTTDVWLDADGRGTQFISEPGNYTVVASAVDVNGNPGSKTVTLRVRDRNHAPTISSSPVTAVAAGDTYQYNLLPSDPDGDALTYAVAFGPSGLEIDNAGHVRWVTTGVPVGSYDVDLRVVDEFGAAKDQPYTLRVTTDAGTPTVALRYSANPAAVNSTVTIWVDADDDLGVVSRTLTVGGQNVTLGPDYSGQVTVTTVGVLTVEAT